MSMEKEEQGLVVCYWNIIANSNWGQSSLVTFLEYVRVSFAAMVMIDP